jgi:hypothetical protein
MTVISSSFSGDRPISCAEGRHGDVIIAQEGSDPLRWKGSGQASPAGIPAPGLSPSLSASADKRFYIARTDVTKPGAAYYAPPAVTYEFDCAPPPTGFRAASSKAYLEQSSLSEIDTTTGGKYYPCEPTVSLSDTHGKGAVLKAVLDAPEAWVSDPANSSETGLTGFAMVSDGPPWADEQALPNDARPAEYAIWEYVDVPISGNGIQRVTGPKRWFSTTNCNGGTSSYFVQYSTDVEVIGRESGSGAQVRIFSAGHQYLGADCSCPTPSSSFCFFNLVPATGFGGAAPYKMGAGYASDAEIAIIIPAVSVFNPDTNQTVYYDFNAGSATKTVNALHWQKAIVVRAYAGEDPRNPGGGIGHPIKNIEIESGGSGYLVAPQLKIVSSTGFGAYATCTVSGGAITGVTLENGGGGYKTRPEIKVLSGGAEAFAIARPHLRGTYQCYYRYVDFSGAADTRPIPSNLSPVRELDVGEGTAGITWDFAQPPQGGRVTHIELWRSTSGQAQTVYRVARIAVGLDDSFYDDLTDEELRDPDRDGYEAMPILLPNGELNAMRFVPPPSDKSAVVRFQDRMWYGVGGEQPNAIYYSEVDEPESVPSENEIVVQQNDRDFDSLQAMIPFGSTLFLAQQRHLFSLTFSQIPSLDGQVAPVSYRGCLNQRCWQIHEGHAYIADRYGMYRINQSGAVEDLTDAVHDQFESQIDFQNTAWFFVSVDPSSRTARFFVTHKDDGESDFPTRALCFGIDSQTLWWEKYPQQITGSSLAQLANGEVRSLYAGQGGAYAIDTGSSDLARGAITSVLLSNGGRGYKAPPKVRPLGGNGARLQAALNQDGEVASIWILEPGYGYSSGELAIDPPDDRALPEDERVTATASFVATSLSRDTKIWPTFHFKSGCTEYVTDADARNGGSEQRRDLHLYYKPTAVSNELSVRAYYNNSPHPRANVAERDRGTGFVDSVVDPAARMNLGYFTEAYGRDTGASRVIRTGKTFEDIRSGDRDVAIEVCGPSRGDAPVTFFSIDVLGGSQ